MNTPFTAANDILINLCEQMKDKYCPSSDVPNRVMVSIMREEIAKRLGIPDRELCEKICGTHDPTPDPEVKKVTEDQIKLKGYIIRDTETGDFLAHTKDGGVAYTNHPFNARIFLDLKRAEGFRKDPNWKILKLAGLTVEKVDSDAYEKALKKFEDAKAELEKFGQ